jgi:hypothetical protein
MIEEPIVYTFITSDSAIILFSGERFSGMSGSLILKHLFERGPISIEARSKHYALAIVLNVKE